MVAGGTRRRRLNLLQIFLFRSYSGASSSLGPWCFPVREVMPCRNSSTTSTAKTFLQIFLFLGLQPGGRTQLFQPGTRILQPARRQNRRRRPLLETRRNGRGAKHVFWILPKPTICPTFSTFSTRAYLAGRRRFWNPRNRNICSKFPAAAVSTENHLLDGKTPWPWRTN